jgi:hypothetical protein
MDCNFDRQKLFYPYVISYVISLHGLVELASRHFYTKIKEGKQNGLDLDSVLEQQNAIEIRIKEFISKIYNNDLVPTLLLDEMSLKSEYTQSQLVVPIDEVANDLVENHIYLLPFQMKAAGILLIMSYEISRDKYGLKDEMWNFFYHCRNAAAHGGQFNITNLKRFPARWANFEITQTMNGTNLFKDPITGGLLSLGDPIYFLYDIENKYMV